MEVNARNDHEGDVIMADVATVEHCPQCGGEIRVGMWPFCKGDPKGHEPVDEYRPFVPYVEEYLFEKPTRVESYQHYKKLARQIGAEEKGRRVGMPGCEV